MEVFIPIDGATAGNAIEEQGQVGGALDPQVGQRCCPSPPQEFALANVPGYRRWSARLAIQLQLALRNRTPQAWRVESHLWRVPRHVTGNGCGIGLPSP